MHPNVLSAACLAAAIGWSCGAFALGTAKPAGSHVAPVAPVHQHAAGLHMMPAPGKFGASPGGAGAGHFGGCAALYPRPAGC